MEFLIENEKYIEILKMALSVKNSFENNGESKQKVGKPLEIDTSNSSPLANKILNNTKEFGNISSINVIETPQNFCNSILESDCLLVKILNENQQNKTRENSLEKYGGGKQKGENEFRKQKYYEKNECNCNHEELLYEALKEIKELNDQIGVLKNENDVFFHY